MHSETYILSGQSYQDLKPHCEQIQSELSRVLNYEITLKILEIPEGCALEVSSFNKEIKMKQLVLSKIKRVFLQLGIPLGTIESLSAREHEKSSRFDISKVFLNLLLSSAILGLLVCIMRAGYHYFFSSFPEDWLTSYLTTFGIWTGIWFFLSVITGSISD